MAQRAKQRVAITADRLERVCNVICAARLGSWSPRFPISAASIPLAPSAAANLESSLCCAHLLRSFSTIVSVVQMVCTSCLNYSIYACTSWIASMQCQYSDKVETVYY